MAREGGGEVYCLGRERVSGCLCCTAYIWTVSYQNVRRTFPIGLPLLAVCLNVKAIG